ncbi:MAG: tRNA pseudouridine(55) synthase TruB [Crocinitomicaceae bacterium]|nr:tRNA pseudouridine(55) synthase TruB [Crocinitomicaceae bacterium]
MFSKEAFLEGQTVLIDKPLGWTSFDVVKKIRWAIRKKYSLKKIKVGHAGTLDPLATGLLIICIGKHTKRIQEYMIGEKHYTGTFLLGKTTPSYDMETDFDKEFPTDHITSNDIKETTSSFVGVQDQYPPIYSAKKIDGKRAYKMARKGESIDLKPSTIEIVNFEIDSEKFPEINFAISCSKGTYIRSIASDFGKRLNSGATLLKLRRESSGNFNILDAIDVNEFVTQIEQCKNDL